MMDAMDALTSNAELYWARLNGSTRCFEPESSPTGPVHIIDIPVGTKPLPDAQTPLEKHEFTDLKPLEDFLDDPAYGDYKSRLM